MTYGIRTPTFDTSRRIGKILGTVETGTSNGSATFDFSGGQGVAIVAPKGGSLALIYGPQITVSGNTLSWSWDAIPAGDRVDCILTVAKY